MAESLTLTGWDFSHCCHSIQLRGDSSSAHLQPLLLPGGPGGFYMEACKGNGGIRGAVDKLLLTNMAFTPAQGFLFLIGDKSEASQPIKSPQELVIDVSCSASI